jgi:uncharacterized membrane protein
MNKLNLNESNGKIDIKKEFKFLVITGVVLLILDSIFLTIISGYFDKQILAVQKEPLHVNIWGAAICYTFLVIGIYYFIIRRGETLLNAFLLGIFIYGVYEYTSYALLKNWKIETTLIDTFWGGILFMLTALIVYKIKSLYTS